MSPQPPRAPVFLSPGDPVAFPDPRAYDPEGLVAVGGDLSPERLTAAYASGVFPWYDEGYLPMWWSPDPRGVVAADDLHVSRSLAKVLRRGDYRLTWNHDFRAVMAACGEQRAGGTWIFDEMLEAYGELHRRGRAHSLEVWRGEELVGGTYGVQAGGLFAAESKFHRRTDMSKVALVALVRSLSRAGVSLIDVQFVTDHLRGLGARQISRADYLARLEFARCADVDLTDLSPTVGLDLPM
ncbi:MAG: leucyl/phenylalanyl-tRNA--protein transferase [Planctomycetota bacterium]